MPTRRGDAAGPPRRAQGLSGTRPTSAGPRRTGPYVGRVPRSTDARRRGPACVLPHDFYARPTLTVAEDLLGKVLVHRTRQGVASGVIVETEAYIGEDDPACHASFGRTARSEPLFGPAGFAYVYLNYGVHYLVNAVTEADGYPGAVLIRALQPLEGLELMKTRRAPDGRAIDEHDLCRGPGNLTKALGITITHNRLDLADSALTIEDRGVSVGTIATGPRVGIRVAVERPWRYWVEGHKAVSGRRKRA